METAVNLPVPRRLPALRRMLPFARPAVALDFAALVREHQGVVRGFLRRLCDVDATADDLAQETFLKAKRGLSSYRGEGSVRSWLLSIAYREFVSARRSRAGRNDLVDLVDDEDPGSHRRTDRPALRVPHERLARRRLESQAC